MTISSLRGRNSVNSFCTLFDSNYISRGLAMYRSLRRECSSFTLYIFAFDDRCLHLLRQLNLPNVVVISLEEFEDHELLAIKETRTRVEYCWTCTSSTILYVLERFGVNQCTYLDADLFFLGSPDSLFDEMGGNSILITEHRYTPMYDKSNVSGKYCVQFISFRNDERGLTTLRWWRSRCLEWCYARVEAGKFGDQMYLDDWTTRFEGVHVLQHLGGGVAAWNVQQYSLKANDGKITGKEISTGRDFELIFYHFHYVRFFTDGRVDLGRRILSEQVRALLYKPYLEELESIKRELAAVNNSFDPHGSQRWSRSWKTPLLYAWRRLRGTYHVYQNHKLT